MKAFYERLNLRPRILTLSDIFFHSSAESKNILLCGTYLCSLYIFGVYLWGKTFGWGRVPLDFFDWALINIPRIDFVRDALKNGVVPFHMADMASLHYISDRFFTLP